MTEYFKKNSAINNLIKVAHSLSEKYNIEEMDELISLAREVRANTLNFSLPGDYVLKDLVSLCKDNGIRMAVIGGMALAIHGQVRDTQDIDVLVDRLPPVEKLRDADYMRRFGFYKASSGTGTVLVLDHRRDGQVEMLTANNQIKQFALDTAEEQSIMGVKVPVVTAAALIGLKAHAVTVNKNRKKKDYPDILGVWVRSKPDLSEVKSLLNDEEVSVIESICHE